ncbi:MAG: hypothetical protein R2710_09350 [Acidimicrobiales bacterium]
MKSVAARDAAGADGGLDPVVAALENLDAGLGNIVRMIHRRPSRSSLP